MPIPKVHELNVLNERLMARCLERLDALEAGEKAPTVHAHKKVMVKGYVDRVEIALGADIGRVPGSGVAGRLVAALSGKVGLISAPRLAG